ncbi:hypothetical protein KY339_01620 [Candidatus Woesearchaeota archaeon]|nr:hypothetical protein [Candidatus Woesearchaeota archaeon]
MLGLSTTLSYYKRKEIQAEMVKCSSDREIAVKFGERGFGKRPDVLLYPNDILELAKQGATSFHCSEELWNNPSSLSTELKKSDMDALRKGWDLVLDIDSPFWQLSKITGWLLVKALKEHGVNSISAKFSGNKGFHIAVPFEAFPKQINNADAKLLFPEGPRNIAVYLLDYIGENHIKVSGDTINFGKKYKIQYSKIKNVMPDKEKELAKKICSNCNSEVKASKVKEKTEYICPKCEYSEKSEKEESYKKCPKCSYIMEKLSGEKSLCKCGSNDYYEKFNPLSIIEVDTILISSRHLYRVPYSLHEKSGLASVPIDPEKILDFDKKNALPTNVKPKHKFLDRSSVIPGEANELVAKAFELEENKRLVKEEREATDFKDYKDIPSEAIPKELFPPCIKLGLKGLKDGKKRFMFCVVNFLVASGWNYEQIEELLTEWNKKNDEPLREVSIKGHVRYHKQQRKKVLPPNCDNEMYYKGIQLCRPDPLCAKIKNPVNYARRKVFYKNSEQEQEKPKKAKLTEEQKEMRRKYRKKMKEENIPKPL